MRRQSGGTHVRDRGRGRCGEKRGDGEGFSRLRDRFAIKDLVARKFSRTRER